MNKQKSLFLDFIRISAALIVLWGHAVLIFFGDVDSNPLLLSNMRHFAVVLFFVLSGYVIGYTTKVNHRGAKLYMVARLSRLSSMVLPALIITFLIDFIYNFITLGHFFIGVQNVVRYLVTSLFINEIWFFSSAPRLNGVLWSVSFEFFFYVIFGIFFFTKGTINKIFFTSIACLVAGPKILLMFPIWIAGYLAYLYNDKTVAFKSYFAFFSFICLTFYCYVYFDGIPFEIGYRPFYFANQFLTDFICGILFALSILFFPETNKNRISLKFTKNFRKFADFTFPIYILHYPILKLCKVVFIDILEINLQFYLAMFLSLLLSITLGIFFEKFRPLWSKFFTNLLDMKMVNNIIN